MKVKLPYRLSMLCLCAALALPALSDSGNQPLGQVLPFVEAVVGIGRMAGFRVWEHQSSAAQDCKEAVAAWHVLASEQADQHQPQLVATYAGILGADLPHAAYNPAFMLHLLLNVGLRLVEGLTAMAK